MHPIQRHIGSPSIEWRFPSSAGRPHPNASIAGIRILILVVSNTVISVNHYFVIIVAIISIPLRSHKALLHEAGSNSSPRGARVEGGPRGAAFVQ